MDAGFVPVASIGDRVWRDANADGVQDAGEVGVADVTVNLFGANDELIATTLTSSTGDYLFRDRVARLIIRDRE